jgi:hypothetical protein
VFERRKAFDNLAPLVKDHLHQLSTYLEWIEDNSNVIATKFKPFAQAQIFLGLTECSTVNCTELKENYRHITSSFSDILVAGYFSVCKDSKHWPENQ